MSIESCIASKKLKKLSLFQELVSEGELKRPYHNYQTTTLQPKEDGYTVTYVDRFARVEFGSLEGKDSDYNQLSETVLYTHLRNLQLFDTISTQLKEEEIQRLDMERKAIYFTCYDQKDFLKGKLMVSQLNREHGMDTVWERDGDFAYMMNQKMDVQTLCLYFIELRKIMDTCAS